MTATIEDLPNWSKAYKMLLLLQPSSAAAQHSFNDRQASSLQETLSVMIITENNFGVTNNNSFFGGIIRGFGGNNDYLFENRIKGGKLRIIRQGLLLIKMSEKPKNCSKNTRPSHGMRLCTYCTVLAMATPIKVQSSFQWHGDRTERLKHKNTASC